MLLTEFLQSTGASLRIYDMGRRVEKIPRDHFLQFEKTERPYPYPLQQQAWFALSMLDKAISDEPVIWFLRLPLDEQGKLVQAARDYFIHRLLEHAKAKAEQVNNRGIKDALQDNPYTFTPPPQRMACFHAKLAKALKRPPSTFYTATLDYFSTPSNWGQWQSIGYQGIADLAARCDETGNDALLGNAIPHLPKEPLQALCHCLENEPITLALSEALFNRLKQELGHSCDLATLTALARGLSHSQSQTLRHKTLDGLLAAEIVARNIEVLATLSGRYWQDLKRSTYMGPFLEHLARNDAGQDAFNHCLGDLIFLPGMRPHVMEVLRSPTRSDLLAESFQAMTRAAMTL